MKTYLSLFCFLLLVNVLFIVSVDATKKETVTALKNEKAAVEKKAEIKKTEESKSESNKNLKKLKKGKKNKEKKAEANTEKPATAINPDIDGIGTSISSGNKPKAGTPPIPIVVDKSPYKVDQCNQLVMFNADYISDLRDYRKRKQGFFIITALSIFLYDSKDAEKLIHVSNFNQMKNVVQPLRGARGCLDFDGGKATADITVCMKSEADTQAILDAVNKFQRCRNGDNLIPIPPEKIKAISKACNIKEEKITASNFEMDTGVRSGNKWDEERQKFFQPAKIQVPGTPPPPEAKKK